MDFKQYEEFIFNKARDLEVSLFNHYLMNDSIDNCLLALSLYVNEDGGISNINPNNLNNISTLSASIYFLDLITKLNYDKDIDYFNEIISDLIKFMKKQHNFSYYHKTNDDKPCSNIFKKDVYYIELEAITYVYIDYYSNSRSYNKQLNDLITKYLNNDNPSFNEVYYFKLVESLFNNEELRNKIIIDTKLFFNNNELYKLIFNNSDYLLDVYNIEFNNHKDYLLNNRNSFGLWESSSEWSDIYPEAEVASIKYLSITLIDILNFFKYLGGSNV